MPKGRKKPLSIFLSLFLCLIVLIVAGLNFYIVYLLNQDVLDTHKIRVYAGLTAGILLILLTLFIVMCCFCFELLGRLFSGKAGLLSIFFIIVIIIMMSLDFALLPFIKKENYDKAKLFATIVGVIGLALFVIALLIIIIKTVKRGKGDREYTKTLEKVYSKAK